MSAAKAHIAKHFVFKLLLILSLLLLSLLLLSLLLLLLLLLLLTPLLLLLHVVFLVFADVIALPESGVVVLLHLCLVGRLLAPPRPLGVLEDHFPLSVSKLEACERVQALQMDQRVGHQVLVADQVVTVKTKMNGIKKG